MTEPSPQSRRTPGPPPPVGPIGGQLYRIVRGLAQRFQLRRLENRYDRLVVLGAFSFINGCLSIAIMALLAWVTRQAFIFPSLGPTAFLFFYTPLAPAASPRNAVYGHLIGVLAGYGSLALFGLLDAGPAMAEGVSPARIGAAALSLGLTSGAMVMLKAPHPPAGATTLIISLGILHEPWQLVVLMIAVLLLTTQAIVINRLAGLPYPLWAVRADE
ncbi:MAG TPA: HPP family protein [Thermomicrobiales bacterium]|nr:HPP family protein [Thermomicrobiales bacterium]